jgi:MoaA/NifB/PqqE/SkfB family radical SAM enzyme
MYKFKDIEALHVELSSNCQASCPMCARNYHGGSVNPILPVKDIDLESFKQFVPTYFIQQLNTITMCGNFGDPLLNNDLIPIVEYIASNNPTIKIDIHTNGSLRSSKWWKNLAAALPSNHLVQFGIDGLEDTHALYRIGTDFNKIIANAKTFINAGGKARWNFITFKHNEHQLELARQMAKDLKFESFYEKQTSRFIGNPWFDVEDKLGNVTHRLEPPTEQKLIFVDKKTVENYKELIKASTIKCEVEETNSVYIDALGYLWPCCFVGGTPYIHTRPAQLVHNFQTDSKASLNKLLEKFSGIEQLNLRNRSVNEIVDSVEWQSQWDESFVGDKLHVCARTCGKFPEPVVSQCRDQFVDLDTFNE